jgi:hypothetical protein
MDEILRKYQEFLIQKRYSKNTQIYLNKVLIQGIFKRELLSHNSSKTTEIYTHVSKKAIGNIKNPVDKFFE